MAIYCQMMVTFGCLLLITSLICSQENIIIHADLADVPLDAFYDYFVHLAYIMFLCGGFEIPKALRYLNIG